MIKLVAFSLGKAVGQIVLSGDDSEQRCTERKGLNANHFFFGQFLALIFFRFVFSIFFKFRLKKVEREVPFS